MTEQTASGTGPAGRDRTITIILVLLSLLLLDRAVLLLQTMQELFIPFVVALFLAVLFGPLFELLERWRVPRIVSVLAAFVITFAALAAVFEILYYSVTAFTEQWTMHRDRFTDLELSFRKSFGIANGPLDEETLLKNPRISGWAKDAAGMMKSFFSDLAVVLVFLLFLLTGRTNLLRKVGRAFPPGVSERILTVLKDINTDVITYLRIKAIVSGSVGLATALILTAFGVSVPYIWGILAFLFHFIPNIGSVIAVALPALFTYVQTASDVVTGWVFVSLLAMHFIVGNVLEPKVMSRSIDLSPVVILFSLIFWSYVWGIPGMFLAVPITVIIKIVLDHIGPLRPVGVLMGDRTE